MSLKKSFKFSGPIESSKSIVNRALILKAIHPGLDLQYHSRAQDVLDLIRCLNEFNELKFGETDLLKSDSRLSLVGKDENHIFDVGDGGTTFRFFSFFLSKYLGHWTIRLSKQLSQRPQQDLIDVLSQLGVESNIYPNMSNDGNSLFSIRSNFWSTNSVTVDFSKSSQFFSGLALAASDAKKEFQIHCLNRSRSSSYENITIKMLRNLGMEILDEGEVIRMSPLAQPPSQSFNVGADWSSVNHLLGFCFSGSEVEVKNVDLSSAEPDAKGLEFLRQLGLNYEIQKGQNFSRILAKPSALQVPRLPVRLRKNPDMFPQIVALLSQITLLHQVEAVVEYPEQLVFKESNRLNLMVECLKALGFVATQENTMLRILPTVECVDIRRNKELHLDSASDHRIIMSYELLKSFGYKITYANKEAVKKSFSNFFEIING